MKYGFSFLLAGLFLLPASLSASFEEQLTGGRATALDGAMTAASDDVFSLYYNPAAAVHVASPEIGTQYGELYKGLDDNSNLTRQFLGFVYPLKSQAVGVSYNTFSLSNLYKEETLGLSFARRLGDRVNLGTTFKYLSKTIGRDSFTETALDPLTGVSAGQSDPVFDTGHVSHGFSVDLGGELRVSEKYMLGAMVMNVNEPNLALSSQYDPAPRILKAGVSRRGKTNLITLDVSNDHSLEGSTRLHGGLEQSVGKQLVLRIGGGYGNRDYLRFTTGLAVQLGAFQLDYGFMMPFSSISGSLGTHQASLIFRFGKTVEDPATFSKVEPKPVEKVVQTVPPIEKVVQAIPPKPERRDLLPTSNRQLTATWGAVDNAAAYELVASREPTLSRTAIAGRSWSRLPIGTVSGLVSNTRYNLFVRACNEGGCSDFSDLGPTSTQPNPRWSYKRFTFHVDTLAPADPKQWSESAVAQAEIAEFDVFMRKNKNARAELLGHTDSNGDEVDRMVISHDYVKSFRDYLVNILGMDARRLTYRGCGAEEPIADNAFPETAALNRRVEAVILFDYTPPSQVVTGP